ncbi:MAG: hypothetical protein ACXVXS_12190 [Blastococcus sp.]
MRRGLRAITLAVLVVLIGGGWYGGLSFVTDPSGGGLGMTTAELPKWPLLGDYTLPGVALIAIFGVLPVVALVLLVRRPELGWPATTVIGALLAGWMVGQILALGLTFPAMQLTFLVVGLALVVLGLLGGRAERADRADRAERADHTQRAG